jgi:cysteinyl-tRNA synthetase
MSTSTSRRCRGYGKLSGRTLDEAEAGGRVGVSGDKRNPADFALWKKADESHIMRWDSPWGEGFPGWHVECSAMAAKYLGVTIDIHGGGLENQFPHHECEIAQCEGAHDAPFVRYWMHNNMVTLNGQKMGKSLGNAITLEEFFTGSHKLLSRAWSPEVIRFFLLQSHYRSTTDFSEKALESAESGYLNLMGILEAINDASGAGDTGGNGGNSKVGNGAAGGGNGDDGPAGEPFDLQKLRDGLYACMNDDFNTARAIGVLFEQLRPLKAVLQSGRTPSNITDLYEFLKLFCGEVLGIWQPGSPARVAASCRLTGSCRFCWTCGSLRARTRTGVRRTKYGTVWPNLESQSRTVRADRLTNYPDTHT